MNKDLHTFEGALWRGNSILRPNYSQHHRHIETGQDLRASLRAGEFAWPGGYQLAFFTSDGACLCFACVRAELANVLWSIRNECNDGWRVDGLDIVDYYEESPLNCSHCDKCLNAETEGDTES